MPGPAEIMEPGFPLRSGMLGSALYYLTVHTYQLLTPREGAALVITLFVAHVCA